MCLAELIAWVWCAAFPGDILKKSNVVSHRIESSLVQKVGIGSGGMSQARNNSSREENE